MNTDYIDLLYLHIDDMKTPQEEVMSTLAEVVKKGHVKNIGCSNFRTWRIEKARKICEKNDYPFFCAVQQRYSYFQPAADADFGVQIFADNELKSYIAFHKDITMISHTPLLHGAYFKDIIEDGAYDTLYNRERLQKLKTEKNPVAWVLKYITAQFGGSVVLFTTSNEEHLCANMESFTC
jgi:aryl-alcohol dehydrogenase-like predicted oxidoreductase